jgi:hypothetical protein
MSRFPTHHVVAVQIETEMLAIDTQYRTSPQIGDLDFMLPVEVSSTDTVGVFFLLFLGHRNQTLHGVHRELRVNTAVSVLQLRNAQEAMRSRDLGKPLGLFAPLHDLASIGRIRDIQSRDLDAALTFHERGRKATRAFLLPSTLD